MKKIFFAAALAGAAMLASCGGGNADGVQKGSLSKFDSLSYALGANIGYSLGYQMKDIPFDAQLIRKGVEETALGKSSLSHDDALETLRTYFMTKRGERAQAIAKQRAEADSVRRSYPESVVFPYPRRPCRIEIFGRNAGGHFEKRFSQNIDPASCFVAQFTPRYETFEVAYNGNPAHRVDIVLLPEGYGAGERAKFEAACREFAREFFSYSPFREYASRFNIRAVWAPSADSGVTIPGERVWRNTACGASFYTFGSERYQMVDDFQRLRDIAAHVPYDYIYVLSNTQKYGGGGIFNFYGISAAHHPTRTGKIYVHEFGHLLLGLGDEYVGTTSYDDMYARDIEPWEANLTTLVGFEDKFWKAMVPAGTPVPTPDTPEYEGVVGVFEGGGYAAKGVYRPWRNCLMNNLHRTDEFCPVCTKAICDYIEFLCR